MSKLRISAIGVVRVVALASVPEPRPAHEREAS